MPDRKISELTDLAAAAEPTDELVVYDPNAGTAAEKNKRVSLTNLLAKITERIADKALRFTAPSVAPAVSAAGESAMYTKDGKLWFSVNGGAWFELPAYAAPQGRNLTSKVKGVIVHIGDSNTIARPGYRNAYQAEWLSVGGPLENWTSYNLGQNGSTLLDWATNEITNVDNPTYSSLPPIDCAPGNDPGAGRLARAINANPDLIILQLGTNDLNNPGARASYGTESNLRNNLQTLVNFLLARTHATIVLRMPQPFAHEDFSGITLWVDANEAAEASRRLRVVYQEWIGKNSRVEVYDSHTALYGNRCDNKATDCQDPWLGSGNPLLSDSLHPTDLGFRRTVQQIGQQFAASHLKNPIIGVLPNDTVRFATWSTTLYTSFASASSGTSYTAQWDANPAAAIVGQSASLLSSVNGQVGTVGFIKPFAELGQTMGDASALQQLLAIPIKSLLYAYSHKTKTTTALTGLSFIQWITSGGFSVAQLTITAADVTGLGGGAVTFYTLDPSNQPYQAPSVLSVSMAATQHVVAVPYLPYFTIKSGLASRTPGFSLPVITAYLANQADLGYINGPDNFVTPGKPIGTFSFTNQGRRIAFAWNTTNFPSSLLTVSSGNDVIVLKITSGVLSDFGGSVQVFFSDR